MSDQYGQVNPPVEGYPAPPQAPAGAAGYSPVGYPANFGPPGKPRGIGTSILLAIVTLSIYTYVWTWKTHEEIKNHSGQGVGGPLGFVIYFIISPVTFFLLPGEIRKTLERAGRPSRVKGTTGCGSCCRSPAPLFGTSKSRDS